MLSILIPSYNFEISKLIADLNKQATELQIKFEIVVIDDASNSYFRSKNSNIRKHDSVKYFELSENIGRSKIRNKLAEMANYQNLLFMDCDSQVVDNKYISNYLPYCNKENLVCGGRTYTENPPVEKSLYLRWLYGVKRECSNAEIRNQYPNKSFMTNNFLISKKIFSELKFDENISGYGHEDTLFGIELKQKGIAIKHIDNPLIHVGLESAEEFLSKTQQGISNLKKILENYPQRSDLIDSVKILKYYNFLEKTRAKFMIKVLYLVFRKRVEKNLHGNTPNLKLFDFYKLANLCLI